MPPAMTPPFPATVLARRRIPVIVQKQHKFKFDTLKLSIENEQQAPLHPSSVMIRYGRAVLHTGQYGELPNRADMASFLLQYRLLQAPPLLPIPPHYVHMKDTRVPPGARWR